VVDTNLALLYTLECDIIEAVFLLGEGA